MGNAPPKLTPKEQLKLYQKDLRRAIRSLEREQRNVERSQDKIAVDIRKAAKAGNKVRISRGNSHPLLFLIGLHWLLVRAGAG
jgi:hypothetical protein